MSSRRQPYKILMGKIRQSAKPPREKGVIYGREDALEIDVDEEYLKWLLEVDQKGYCPYCLEIGIKRKLDLNRLYNDIPYDPLRPSVDRKDSEKGYIKGNIVITFFGLNGAKNRAKEDVFFEFMRFLLINETGEQMNKEMKLLEKFVIDDNKEAYDRLIGWSEETKEEPKPTKKKTKKTSPKKGKSSNEHSRVVGKAKCRTQSCIDRIEPTNGGNYVTFKDLGSAYYPNKPNGGWSFVMGSALGNILSGEEANPYDVYYMDDDTSVNKLTKVLKSRTKSKSSLLDNMLVTMRDANKILKDNQKDLRFK